MDRLPCDVLSVVLVREKDVGEGGEGEERGRRGEGGIEIGERGSYYRERERERETEREKERC